MQYRTARWMGVLAAVCAVQLACGRAEDARYGMADTDQPGMFERDDRRIQVTGCVERGVIPSSFMLTSATVAGTGTEGAVGTTGIAGEREAVEPAEPAMDGAESDVFTLRALDGRNLGQYVGQRVSVEGTLIRSQAYEGETAGTTGMAPHGDTAAAGTDTPGTMAPAAGASMPTHQLAADTIQVVDAVCGTGGEAEIGGGDAPRQP